MNNMAEPKWMTRGHHWVEKPWLLFQGDSEDHYIIIAGEYALDGDPDLRADVVVFTPKVPKMMALAGEMFDVLWHIDRCGFEVGHRFPNGENELRVTVPESVMNRIRSIITWIQTGRPHGPECGCSICKRIKWREIACQARGEVGGRYAEIGGAGQREKSEN